MNDSLYYKDAGGYFRTYLENDFAAENGFKTTKADPSGLPSYDQINGLLPHPVWDGHEDELKLYDYCWQTAFGNLRRPSEASGFIRNYIDPAFNGNVFLWDSVFMLFFGLYGRRAFNFQGTLDNFYFKQHPDGFICREINEETGEEQFQRYDPSGTGPNLLAWSEWRYYRFSGDESRLKRVFPVIAGYHRWLRNYRSWQDGSYYSTGWGCGMDNQPRFRQPYRFEFFHGFNSWIDTTCQQILSAKLLVRIAEATGRTSDAAEFIGEAEKLTQLVNERMWNEDLGFYTDKYADGGLSDVMTVGAFWALLAGIVPPERLKRFTSHLNDPATFCRPHRVPTLAANSPYYCPDGGYWRGSVWSPTNYMVLEGLTAVDEHSLAAEIADNHYANILEVFRKTGTVYENYAPESPSRGVPSASSFVGWTGISGINVLLEYQLGIRADVPSNTIVWTIRQAERHGVMNYPFGEGTVNLICEARKSSADRPQILITGNVSANIQIHWPGGTFTVSCEPQEST